MNREAMTAEQYAAHLADLRADLGIEGPPALASLVDDLRALERRERYVHPCEPTRERLGLPGKGVAA